MVHLIVLSTHCVDSCPCVVLVTENNRILFDVGEGTQRLCVEHGVKLAKMNDVFLTRFSPDSVGGLPGLCLTMAEVVKDDVRLHGPNKLSEFLKATQRFMKIVRFSVPVHDSLASSTHLCDDVIVHALRFSVVNNGICSHMCYVGETPTIKGKFDVNKAAQLKVPKGPLYGKLKNGETITLPTGEVIEPSQVLGDAEPPRYFAIVCNIADNPDSLLRSFPDNSLFKRFGENGDLCNQLECMIHLSPPNILQTSEYSAWIKDSFASNVQHISAYHGHSSFQAAALHTTKLHKICPSFFGDLSSLSPLLPLEQSILKGHNAGEWFKQGQPLMKIVLSPGHKRGLEEAAVVSAGPEAEQFFAEAQRLNPDLNTDLQYIESLKQSMDQQNTSNETASRYRLNSAGSNQLRSHANNRLLFLGTGCAVPSKYRNVSGILLQFASSHHTSMLIDVGEGTWQQLLKMARSHPLLFPSASSNSSSADGGDDRDALAAALQLKLVWISHPHADHHLGLITVIMQRRALILKHCPHLFKPLVVIASTAVLLFLHDCCTILDHLANGYIGASCRQFDPLDPCDMTDAYLDVLNETQSRNNVGASLTGVVDSAAMDTDSAVENYRPAYTPLVQPRRKRQDPISDESPCKKYMNDAMAAAKECFETLGIDRLQNVPVAHCSQSYGLILESISGDSTSIDDSSFKLVYSGDTRPCANLIQYGQHATILIHEATFEDDKWSEAVVKKHSTIGEALDTANSMDAYRVILTHFSQRYPSMPVIDAVAESSEAESAAATVEGSRYVRLVSREAVQFVVAFDYMQLSFSQLLWAPAVIPVLEKAFPVTVAATGDDEDQQGEIGRAAAVVCTCSSGVCAQAVQGQFCVATSGKNKKQKTDLKRKAQNLTV